MNALEPLFTALAKISKLKFNTRVFLIYVTTNLFISIGCWFFWDDYIESAQ